MGMELGLSHWKENIGWGSSRWDSKKIFGPKRDEVTGEWTRLHNEELYDVWSSPNIVRGIKSRRMRWAGHVKRMGDRRDAYRILMGRPDGKRPLGRRRHRWEPNTKISLREVGWRNGLIWSGSGQRKVVGSWQCGNEPSSSIKCDEYLD
jgi:hypothetical protein